MKFRLLRIPLVSLAVCLLAAAAFAADPTGIWQWTTKGHRGHKMNSSLQLQLQNGQLTGTLSNRMGDTPINDATFKDNVVAFSVMNDNDIAIKYSGTLAGDTINGTVVTPGRDGGNPVTRNWTAKRVPGNPPPPPS